MTTQEVIERFDGEPAEIGEMRELVDRLSALLADLHYIDLEETPWGMWGAYCGCGWTHDGWKAERPEAVAEARAHLAENPRPSWEKGGPQ